MPLVKGASQQAISRNIKTEIEAGKPRKQAIAIGLDVARRLRRNRAAGGQVFGGPIVSDVPGRTDHHPMAVAAGSYVLPAENVSNLGENNTLAGLSKLRKIGAPGLRKMVHSAPGARNVLSKHRRRAAGGRAPQPPTGEPIEINAAGGEHVLTPEEVSIIGDGDVILGHALLDNWVMQNRRKHIETLRRLPPPAKD